MGIFPRLMDRLEKLMEQDMKEALTQAAMQGIGLAANPPVVTGHAVLGGGGGGGNLGTAGAVYQTTGSSNIFYDAQRDIYIDMSTGQRFPANKMSPSHMPHTLESSASREAMLHMRLRNGWTYQHLTTAYVGDKVYVFVIQNDQPVILEDDATMFPSDQLITQLRLIGK